MSSTSEVKKNKKKSRFIIDILTVSDEIVIRGVAREKYACEDDEVVAKDRGGNEYAAEYSLCPVYDVTDEETQSVKKGWSRVIRLPLSDHAAYSFYLRKASGKDRKLSIRTGRFSKLTGIDDSFIRAGDHIIKLREDSICVYDYRLRTYLASAFRYNRALKQSASPEMLRLRKKGLRERRRHSRPVWIVSDRTDVANDNGEALFTWLMNSEYKDKYDIYFVIGSDSKDYERLKSIGPVLAYGSEEHLVKQMAASAVIASAGENWVFNPYGKDQKYFRDILDYKFIFLQHGIIKDDLSDWLHLYKKNIGMFVTSANAEYESIINGDYGYGPDVVKLTGLARFDRLTSDPQKTVAIMPTWRSDIAAPVIPGTSGRVYSETFKDTDYFRFYNRLIHDERLNAALERTGYKGIFYMHPAFKEQAGDFNDAENVSVWRDKIEYSRVFCESSLMVTDYSSVAMDFAYLKKPVIYTHFDREHFLTSHSYTEGYFSYERDGFGPVVYDLDSTVSAIVKALEDDCREPEEYLERIDGFFAYTDRDNCKRIAAEIENITKPGYGQTAQRTEQAAQGAGLASQTAQRTEQAAGIAGSITDANAGAAMADAVESVGNISRSGSRFLFSVILPVYNVEDYLEEAIDSVIAQTVGFENIQMILVNDGSPDGSPAICRRYHEKYPDNIVFIDKPNGGVSSARNEGMRHATGEFVAFLDPDDIWDAHAFERFLKFFRKHPDVNFASARMELFGRRNGFIHHLDYEYKKTRVIDIDKIHDHPQYSAARTVFRATAIADMWFDESLAIAEDMLFMNLLILREKKFGVVREAVYRYRRAEDSASAIDNQWRKKGFYLDIIDKVHRKLIDYSVSRYGEMIPYLQYALMTDFRFRITKPHEEVLSPGELASYMQTVKELLLMMDDDIILENRGLSLTLKTDALRAKYGDDAFDLNDDLKRKLADKLRMTVRETAEDGAEIVLSGTAFEKYIDDGWVIIASDESGRSYEPDYVKDEPYVRRFSQGTMVKYMRKISLPADADHSYRFHLVSGTDADRCGEKTPLRLSFGSDAKLSTKEGSAWVTGSSVITATGDTLKTEKKEQ